jgi:hypothetical protein
VHYIRSVMGLTRHLLLQSFETFETFETLEIFSLQRFVLYPFHAPNILGSNLCIQVLSAMGSLAQAEGFPSGADLLSAHLASILPLLSPAATWHTQARDLQVYCLIKSLTSAASNPPDAER